MTPIDDTMAGLTGSTGSTSQTGGVSGSIQDPFPSLAGVLDELRSWLAQYVSVTDDLDIDLLTLWAAHTHVPMETYSSPRLILDSILPGSGKTTVLEHMQRFAYSPIQAASLSSPALLARMLDKGMRTILIDEADRSLDPKKPGVEDLIAIINSGYKRGATRPVLVPVKGGAWDIAEMSTYSPVAMAGNAPQLPDDTRSRSIRVLLMPDLEGRIKSSDWEDIEADADELAQRFGIALDDAREQIAGSRPPLPAGCVGRMREKWNPLMRVAAVATPRWVDVATRLIERDLDEARREREAGLMRVPITITLARDIHTAFADIAEPMIATCELLDRLVTINPDMWGDHSNYGKRITAQRLGRMLAQSKVYATRDTISKVRGYARRDFEQVWRHSGAVRMSTDSAESTYEKQVVPSEPVNTLPVHPHTPQNQPVEPVEPVKPAMDAATSGTRCSSCGKGLLTDHSIASGLCVTCTKAVAA